VGLGMRPGVRGECGVGTGAAAAGVHRQLAAGLGGGAPSLVGAVVGMPRSDTGWVAMVVTPGAGLTGWAGDSLTPSAGNGSAGGAGWLTSTPKPPTTAR
jgi:hypothetical protein